MPTRIIRSFADLDAMQGRVGHVLTLFSGGLDSSYVLKELVQRNNIEGGETTVTDNDGQVLWQRTLQRPLDTMIGRDNQTMHAVTPVTPVEAGVEAWRDVLVIAFSKVAP